MIKRILCIALLSISIPMTTHGALSLASTTKLYVSGSSAKEWVKTHKVGKDANKAKLIEERIAKVPQAIWITSDDLSSLSFFLEDSSKKKAVPVFVLYNIPNRDIGLYSEGGSKGSNEYKRWIDSIAKLIGKKNAVLILEPDALMHNVSTREFKERTKLLTYAIKTLKKNSNTRVYLDGGNAEWHSAEETAKRLKQAGIAYSDGFSLNVSNFIKTDKTTTFGNTVSTLVNGKHFVIDTSRNGSGTLKITEADSWCNPPGRSLGQKPTFTTKNPLVDAYLWIKRPGESDGECRGGPKAGQFWLEYALGLLKK